MKQRVLLDMIESVPGNFKVLIVDKNSAEILSACLRMSELMDHGVTLVEDISNVRQPITASPGIYFVSPVESTLKLLVQDWATKDKYKEAHIFFTSKAPTSFINDVAPTNLGAKIRNVKEMLLDFSVPEQLSFHFGQIDEMVKLLGPSVNQQALQLAATKLTSVIHTIGDNPLIRYQNNKLCQTFASMFVESLEKMIEEEPSMGKIEPRSILLIIDRSIDPAAAVLHDRYYEGALEDLYPLQNMMFKQSYKDRTGKDAVRDCLIDEQDPLWCKYRHSFLASCLTEVPAALNKLLADNPALAGGMEKGSGAKLSDVGSAIRALPEFQAKQQKLSMHTDILSNIMSQIKNKNVNEAAAIEQQIVNGEGSFKEWFDAVKKFAKTSAPDETKLRVLLILTICSSPKDLTEAKKQQLIQECGLDFDADKVNNIDAVIARTGTIKAPKKKGGANGTGDNFVCQVKLLLEALCSEAGLSTTDFPFARPGDANVTNTSGAVAKKSLRSGASRAAGAGGLRPGERQLDLGHDELITLANPQKIVVFVLGGVTRCEVRAAYEVARELKREAIVGSTSQLRPDKFLRQLPGMK